jgi:CubicO group peptidase (beta-lactamase class C family)
LQNSLDSLLETLNVTPGVAPAASVALGVRKPDGSWRHELGATGRLALDDERKVSADTIFDLASVTKPFFAAAVARALDLDAPLASVLYEAKGTPVAGISLELLLAHRSGLEAHRPLFQPLQAGRPFRLWEALETACWAHPGTPPEGGFPALYSDLGYLLLGVVATRQSGLSLSALVRREVLTPLGIEDIGSAAEWLLREPTFVQRTAATEIVPWRGGTLRGVVHDENAWALSGHGLSGHAGSFGTAQAVLRFGCAIVDALRGDESWLRREQVALLTRPRPGGTLRAGFDGVSMPGSAAGSRKSPETVGHLGFTGTSLWCDPRSASVTVLLTNRVHPTRAHLGIRAARPAVEDALFERVRASRD